MNFKRLLVLAMSMRLYIIIGVAFLIGAHYVLSVIWFEPTASLDDIEAQLKRDASNVNTTDDNGFTGVIKAIAYNDYEKLALLLKYGAAVNDQISSINMKAMNHDPQTAAHFDGATPLHFAIMYGNYLNKTNSTGEWWYDTTDIVQLLLSYGADPNARDKNNDTPIHKLFFMDQPGTSEDRRFQILELLLAYGADINAQNNQGDTMAHDAAERNYGQWLQRMINVYGDIIDFTIKNNAGLTPRDLADKNGYGFLVEILDYMLKPVVSTDNVTERDAQGRTGLMRAISKNNYEMAVDQIKRGANVNAADNNGNTPLIYALNNRKRPLIFVTLLLSHGAQANGANKEGNTPLLLAINALPRNERLAIVTQLLAKGADQNSRDKKLNTPLHKAIMNGDVELIKLLKNGFASDLKNSQGLTAAQLAIKRGNKKVLEAMGK